MAPMRMHIPAASHAPGAVMRPPTQIGRPHSRPEGLGMHMPSLPGRSHESQSPSHALEQQTPSAQKPDVHSLFAAQVPPRSTGVTQRIVAVLQSRPPGQLPDAHAGLHAEVPEHRPEGHAMGAGTTQVPVASHMPTSVSVPKPPTVVQLGLPQGMPTVRGDQSVVLRAGSQTWHGFALFTVKPMMQAAPMKQPPPTT